MKRRRAAKLALPLLLALGSCATEPGETGTEVALWGTVMLVVGLAIGGALLYALAVSND